jgi:hypothetical protein
MEGVDDGSLPFVDAVAMAEQGPYDVDDDGAFVVIQSVRRWGKFVGEGASGRRLARCGEGNLVRNASQPASQSPGRWPGTGCHDRRATQDLREAVLR